MKKNTRYYLRNFLYYFAVVLAVLILATTLLSMITDTSWRYLKMLDFLRIQYLIGGGITLAVFIWITEKWRWWDTMFAGMIVVSMVCQTTYLINYTSFVDKVVPDAISTEKGLQLMVYNVYIDNTKYDEAVQMCLEADPDVLVILETNAAWQKQLAPMREKYPYTAGTVNEVSYGMTLYSKLPFKDLDRNYLHNEDVPSYTFKIQPDGMPEIQVYSVHPPPPKHFDIYPDNEGKKEKALKIVGDKIKNDPSPAIVMGDLNDIAWGDTEELMRAGGKLRDVRVGRGFYNSFSAHSFFMTWPLDHFFVTEGFTLKEIKMLDNAGSDHFPVMVELHYEQ